MKRICHNFSAKVTFKIVLSVKKKKITILRGEKLSSTNCKSMVVQINSVLKSIFYYAMSVLLNIEVCQHAEKLHIMCYVHKRETSL